MEKSHGKIWFDRSNHGTIFYISLPINADIQPAELPQQLSIPLS